MKDKETKKTGIPKPDTKNDDLELIRRLSQHIDFKVTVIGKHTIYIDKDLLKDN